MDKNIICKGGTLHLIKIPERYTRSVEKSARLALKEASELFEYRKPVEVVIFSSMPEIVIPELGIGGHSLSQGDIVVDIDFIRKDIKKIIQKELPSTILHEVSHVVRGSIIKDPYATLLDSFVTEGIASYIEKHSYMNQVPYIKSIKNEEVLLKKAKKVFNKKNYTWKDHSEWFFGEGKLPRWIGYRLGYLIVSSYMGNNKDISVADLTRMKAIEILKGSE